MHNGHFVLANSSPTYPSISTSVSNSTTPSITTATVPAVTAHATVHAQPNNVKHTNGANTSSRSRGINGNSGGSERYDTDKVPIGAGKEGEGVYAGRRILKYADNEEDAVEAGDTDTGGDAAGNSGNMSKGTKQDGKNGAGNLIDL